MGSPFSGLTGRLAGGLAGGGLAGLAAGHGHNSPTIANLGQQQQPQNQSNVYDIGSPRDKEDSIGTARGRFAGMVGAGQGAAATSSTAAASGARREQWRGSSQWRGTSQQLLDWFDDDKAGVAEMGAADGLGGAGAWTGHSGAPPAAAGAADAAAAGPAMAPRTGAYDYDDVSGGGEPAGGEGGQAAAKQKGGWSHVQVSSLLKESMLEGMFSSSQRDGGFFRLQPQQVKQKVQAIYDQLLSSLQGEVADLQSKIKNSFQPEKGQLQATLAEKELHIANMKGLAARRQSSSDRTWYQLFCHIVSNTAHYTIATSGKKRTAASVTSEGQANKLKRLAGHLKGIYLHGAGQSGLETLRTANIQQQANCERRHAKRAAAEEARFMVRLLDLISGSGMALATKPV
ncbi:hypothetical protein CHLRE_04g217964v5 [Chlamydomonas reinhardtii]|uniref:Uncharacterized protein n=1 Tax=Chlamydomonas reinhardtii TaxID=3055 RepID=A0A2K3DTL0_CHLRE|nr:uncharacterized protein CHLRE_04g217964v5 [Chlamydomonas reinhardtii]PNW83866.1 hypothetical protein CHLRE_04g217964v5 [Chlamydomonas reinhardtii]